MPPPSLLDDNFARLVDDDLAETDLRVLTSCPHLPAERLERERLERVDDSRRCGDKEAWIGAAEEFGIV
jgi:hypothetical protein